MDFKIINKTPIYHALSDLGKRIFLPDGIFYWSGRAKKEAEIIGTIGSAFAFEKDFIDGGSDDWVPCYLEDFKEFSSLNIKSVVPYAPIGGIDDIREIWIKWILKKSYYDEQVDNEKLQKLEKSLTKPIVCQGITNGIYNSCKFFLNPGDFIISVNKRWGNYDNIITKNLGINIKSFEFFVDGIFNVKGLKDSIQEVAQEQEKIVIILNFPNNPTGYCPTKDEVTQIIQVLKESQQMIKLPFIIIVDDAYEPYIYNDNVWARSIFYDIFELDGDIIPVKLDGISKELLAYGGRVGFITLGLKRQWVDSDEELEILKNEINNKLEGLIRSSISNTNHFYQAVTQKMFTEKGMDKIIEAREKVRRMLKKRYELINEELAKIENKDISVDPNAGGFFLFLNLNADKIKASEFADYLLKKYKIGVIPIQKLENGINGIRIAYCSIDIKQIPEFINRIKLALNDY
ncbi:MAG: aminotransferase class I/II-fold pyridoxal phosphate-dependent enzyme [Promethearchaeota archaeon]